jgi:hypothetical protein
MAKQEQEQGPTKEQKRERWGKALEHVMTEGLSWEEKAAHILVVLADRDAEDGGETVADLRRALDRGLDSLTKRGRLKLDRGQYKLVTEQADQRRPMAVDAEQPAEPEREQPAADEPQGRPEVA